MSTICDDLRTSIIDAAFQGKLTKQSPEDGDAYTLLIQLETEKEQLIKDGAIKKQKELPPIRDNEIPYAIPDDWKWIRFNDFFEVSGGSQPPKSKFIFEPKDGYVRLYQTRDYGKNPQPVYIPIKTASKTTKKGDILLARYGGSLGKVFFAKDGAYNVAMAKVIRLFQESSIDTKYLYYFFHTNLYRSVIFQNNRSAQAGFNKDDLNILLFPLPPLTEQKRIVEKIDELMARIADLEQSADALASLKKAFPDDIKASLLQAAMQGKLTKQLPEDGSAEDLLEEIKAEKEKLIAEGKIKKQKPLAPITDNEIPFSIPENWRWVRLDEIANSMSAGKDKPKDFKKEKDESHPYPVIANGVTNDGILGYTGKPTAPKNTLTVAGRGTIGFSLFREYEYCPIVRLIVVDLSSRVDPRFVQLVMQAFPEESLGTSIPQLTVPMLRPKLVPLPPLAEQKRIIERLDTLMQNINVVGDLIASE